MERKIFTDLSVFVCFVFVYLLLNTHASSADHHLCRPDQKDALLSFKNEFPTQHGLIMIPIPPYRKTKSWINGSDCCSWDGVTCGAKSGVMIGLDLSYTGLYGTFNPNSSLFRLNHLRSLNLAGNDFNWSSIPSEFGKLTRLTKLNLSSSWFSGQIPNELLQLTSLVSLDLMYPFSPLVTLDLYIYPLDGLFTDTSFLSILARNLTNLRELQLINIKISSIVPKDFANMSSLRSLILYGCDLLGEFPSGVFLLPHIEDINLTGSPALRGSLPEFPANSSLRHLSLSTTGFSGGLPDSISKLKSLESLFLASANFFGNFLDSIGNLSSLISLDLGYNNFVGEVPRSINNLKQLSELRLSHNKFTGTFPLGSLMINLTKLRTIDFSHNQLTVSLPPDIGINASNANTSSSPYFLPQLRELGLAACNITKIPGFLRTQRDLEDLDLSSNKIQGQVPKWLWNSPVLSQVNLSHNSFIHLEGSSKVLRARNIVLLDLRSNAFEGPLPIPSISTQVLFASANNFTGNIPRAICKLKTLRMLDLLNNSFNGLIPRCLGNVSDVLTILNLRNNNLGGSLPETFCGSLMTLDVGHNKLIGKLPRSFFNCRNIRVLNVESNRINDTFPFWLEDLLGLQVLVLRSNKFHGQMVSTRFSKLQVIDISGNDFFGMLPPDRFASWDVMSLSRAKLSYVGSHSSYYSDSMVLTDKGIEMKYESILTIFNAIDFSRNKFQGQIPESISHLKGLIVLNFSNNIFIGHIPQSLANLTELESMDLSQNKLLGNIPPELGDLAGLERVNFSHNQLTGTIPQGPQFITQDSSSFEGNPKLCGRPLEETCNANVSLARSNQQPEPQEEVVSWIAVAIGYVPGLVFGLTIGYFVASYKHEWLLKVFRPDMRRHFRNR